MQYTADICGWRNCGDSAVCRVSAFESRVLVGDILLCEAHIDEVVRGYRHSRSGLGEALQLPGMRTCEVETLVARMDRQVGHVVLRECEGKRHFVIELNDCDLTSLAWNMRKLSPLPLPTTHVAFGQVLDELGGRLRDVRIYEHARTHEPHFYRAKLTIEQDVRSFEHIVRPTDALNLAHVCDVPIFVATEFLK